MSTTIDFIQGDITQVAVDAIVNAANSRLAVGGGVDAAIHKAGGPSIQEECRKIGGCPTGSAVATGAGQLPAKFVFHAVGPVYHGKEKDVEQLASCHLKCLDLALERGCRSIAFPAVSTGAFGYPVAEASVIAVGSVHGWLLNHPGMIDRILFVLFDAETLGAYQAAQRRREQAGSNPPHPRKPKK
ncbi:MAG TPA: O-acetyl-ADP-ribose deacetylase [Planctomycetota bacterium]|nr:O-acetyl-ADP-ribose deacetylase [Planctomycetota bacterium]